MAEVAVIGLGLMGAAALRHLAQRWGDDVVGIGPPEPAVPEDHVGPFGAWFDSGRLSYPLTRAERHHEYATLARRTSASVNELARRLDEAPLLDPVGHLFIDPIPSDYTAHLSEAAALGIDAAILDTDSIEQRWPFLRPPAGAGGLWVGPPAGVLDPRRMVAAQKRAARQVGARVIDAAATSIVDRDGVFEIGCGHSDQCEAGDSDSNQGAGTPVRARRVVLACGAWTGLYPETVAGVSVPRPQLRLKTETFVLIELAESDATAYRGPTIIYDLAHRRLSDLYLTPPRRYPDDRWYLKAGVNTIGDQEPHTDTDTNAWYRSGDNAGPAHELASVLESLYRELRPRSVTPGRCVITYTPTGLPIVAPLVDGRLYALTGGNGSSAKASDALGELAANLVECGSLTDGLDWASDLDPTRFGLG